MSAKFICDGCGKEASARIGIDGAWHKPSVWFCRSDNDGIQNACSRECIDKISAKTGKTSVVAPW